MNTNIEVVDKSLENRLEFREVEYARAMELEGPVKYLVDDEIEVIENFYTCCEKNVST